MLLFHRIHFPCESRHISWGVSPDNLGEMPHFIAGEFPCTSICVNYVETRNFRFLECSVILNL
jgi:hypothetical protein